MNRKLKITLFLSLLAIVILMPAAQALPGAAQHTESGPDPVAIYSARCVLCHGPGGRASQLSAMASLSAEYLYDSLTTGSMKQQASGLSEAERRALAEYIAGYDTKEQEKSVDIPCDRPISAPSAPSGPRTWNGWSPDLENTRWQSSSNAGLSAAQVRKLTLKWAYVFPNAATAANQPTIINGVLYIGSWDGTIYALNAKTGCRYWTFKADTGVRAAVTVADGLALFGDFQSNVYAVDATNGKLKWRTKVEDHPATRITGSPLAFQGRLYVPVASLEEGSAQDPTYACCTFRGSIVALNLSDGKQVWKTYTIDQEPKKLGVNKIGTPRIGPSGAAPWSAPTIDAKRNLLYVATGNGYNEPDTPGNDAIIAMDLNTGKKKWLRTLRDSDLWNGSCLTPEKINCPPDEGPDYDFGASPVLVRTPGGRELILAGQKSGLLFALDPDKEGRTVWERRVGAGGSFGGILWGMAADTQRAYVSVADWNVGAFSEAGVLTPSNVADGSISAVDLKTGKVLWRTSHPREGCKNRGQGCSLALAAPVTAIPGVAFVGSNDGRLRAFDTRRGRMIWEFDSGREFTGINGLKGRGGSINAAGTTVVDGYVYQTAGYGAFGLGMPGNVLLVFGPSK